MPSDIYTGSGFTACDGDVQMPPGQYVVNGQSKFWRVTYLVESRHWQHPFIATTWSQPATLTAPPPWTPVIPASSSCTTYSSAELFGIAVSTSIWLSPDFSLNCINFSQQVQPRLPLAQAQVQVAPQVAAGLIATAPLPLARRPVLAQFQFPPLRLEPFSLHSRLVSSSLASTKVLWWLWYDRLLVAGPTIST